MEDVGILRCRFFCEKCNQYRVLHFQEVEFEILTLCIAYIIRSEIKIYYFVSISYTCSLLLTTSSG